MAVTFFGEYWENYFQATSKPDSILCGNAENGCMSPVTCIGCFVIDVEGMRREKAMRKRDRNSEEAR
jgi:hypothetical protein